MLFHSLSAFIYHMSGTDVGSFPILSDEAEAVILFILLLFFLDQLKEREAGDDEAHRMDEDFVTALEYGLPPTPKPAVGGKPYSRAVTESSSIRWASSSPASRSFN